MIHTASPELGAHPISGSQTKVRDGKAKAVVEAEDILWLQVAVINIEGMAVLHCVEQLKEHLSNQVVVA